MASNILSHQPATVPTNIRMVSDVSEAAIKQKLANEVGLWLRLRAINHWGSGVLSIETAIEGLIQQFGYSVWAAYRHLNKANGKFIELGHYNGRTTIKIKGLTKVCEYLGVNRITDKHWREVPAAEFTRDRTRAELYASILKPEGITANPMPRDVITERTGLHKVQQRRYEKQVHIKRTPNFSFCREETPVEGSNKPLIDYKPLKVEIFTKDKGFRDINKRLGNSYHTRQRQAAKGMLKKVHAELKGSLIPAEAPSLIKRYFQSFQKLSKTLLRRTRISTEGYYLINNRVRRIQGRLEWCRVEF